MTSRRWFENVYTILRQWTYKHSHWYWEERNYLLRYHRIFQDILAEADKYQFPETPAGEYTAYLQALVYSAVFTDDLVTSEMATNVSSDIEAMELAIGA